MAQRVLVIQHDHMDPVWRRGFQRAAVVHGATIRPYAEIEAAQINTWLALAPAGYSFSEGQAAVWRSFFARYPEQEAAAREHARGGRLDVMLAGETVQDSNMPAAEGLVRNFLLAWPFYRDFCGEAHPALKLAWLEDAFGNSPNLPQVLRGVGAEVACKLSYRRVETDRWMGIDGSTIEVFDHHPHLDLGGFDKHPPCYTCGGVGCAACGGSGVVYVDSGANLHEQLRARIEEAVARPEPWVVIYCTHEEYRSDPRYVEVVAEQQAKYAGQCEIAFGSLAEVYALQRPVIASRAGDADAPADLNPGMPGCYVTRIRNKQRVKALSYRLLAAEAHAATAAWQAGQPVTPHGDVQQAWRKVVFNQFHDAITGTHIDAANAELMVMLDEAEVLMAPHLPPLPAPTLPLAFTAAEAGTRQLGQLEVEFDRIGLLGIRSAGEDLFGMARHAIKYLRPFRIAELVVEEDWGDAWGMRMAHQGSPAQDFTATGLGDWHETVETAADGLRWHGVYRGNCPAIARLAWTTTVTPSADGRCLHFVSEVEWDTHSRRLRVYVPVAAQDATACYEAPFGFIERTYDDARLNYSQWHGHNMEFPALHWVHKRIDDCRGVALFNKGLPCNRWAPGRFDLSLLRSPEMGFCNIVVDPHDVWDIDGWRDTGTHRFEYALFPHTTPVTPAELTRMGYAYNLPAPLDPPFRIDGEVIVSAWKPAEDGQAWVLRLQEANGAPTQVTLNLDTPCRVTPVDLLERPLAAPVATTRYTAPLHRHGLLTVRIERESVLRK